MLSVQHDFFSMEKLRAIKVFNPHVKWLSFSVPPCGPQEVLRELKGQRHAENRRCNRLFRACKNARTQTETERTAPGQERERM